MPSEFDIIRRYFSAATPSRADVMLGIGDDCALLNVSPGHELAISMDTLVAGRHFLPDVDPCSLGHKALAVNLSDLAAMGADPAWFTLALTLPVADAGWLQAFSRGLAALANEHGVSLVGGDTTRGPLSVTIQVHGFVEAGRALRRSTAQVGDHIYVSGTLGDAALALNWPQFSSQEVPAELQERLDRPVPRLALGRALIGVASAAIDISDGLLADLGHICEESGVGARVEQALLPLSAPVREHVALRGDWSPVLAGGDDYELCFTCPPQAGAAIEALADELELPLTRIGSVVAGNGVTVVMPGGAIMPAQHRGFDHFADED